MSVYVNVRERATTGKGRLTLLAAPSGKHSISDSLRMGPECRLRTTFMPLVRASESFRVVCNMHQDQCLKDRERRSARFVGSVIPFAQLSESLRRTLAQSI